MYAPVDLASLVRSGGEGARVTALRHGLAIEIVAPDLPQVLGDVGRLGEVLDNLVGNAIKFSPNGGTMTIEAGPTLADFPNGNQQAQAGSKSLSVTRALALPKIN